MSSSGGFVIALGDARPTAVIHPSEQQVKLGEFLKLIGSGSSCPANNPLTYTWVVKTRPLTSLIRTGDLIPLEVDNSEVAFLPDVLGKYELGLVVNNGSLNSLEATTLIEVEFTEIPYHSGEVPEASFLWASLSDFWSLVEHREALEILFSSIIQMVASQLLRLYQNNFSKALLETPNYFQRRWLSYQPPLDLDGVRQVLYLGGQNAGNNAGTGVIGFRGEANLREGGVVEVAVGAVNPQAVKHTFVVLSGSNAGRYQIVGLTSSGVGGLGYYATPTFSSEEDGVEFRIEELPGDRTDVIFVPISEADLTELTAPASRIFVLGGKAYRILQTFRDTTSFGEAVSGVIVEGKFPPGQRKLAWRIPWVLASFDRDFEAAGVMSGDVLEFNVRALGVELSDRVGLFSCEVVGVVGNRLGFVPTVEGLAGVASPEPSTEEMSVLAEKLGISLEDMVDPDTGNAIGGSSEIAALERLLRGGRFQDEYLFIGLTSKTDIVLTEERFFRLESNRIWRLCSLPVDNDLRSVPALQGQIAQPEAHRENTDYFIEGPEDIKGLDGCAEAHTGEFRATSGQFLQHFVLPGDSLVVQDGGNAGTYAICRVYDEDWLQVFPPFAVHDSKIAYYVSRSNRRRFLRFVPGRFAPYALPPERLWADVSYFAPDSIVEANFGKRLDFARTEYSGSITGERYKEIVVALLYAAMKGPMPENVRRGAQGILGLPLAAHRGKVVEIQEDFRLDHRTGELDLARILVQDVLPEASWEEVLANPDAYLLGRTRVYYYPALRDENPDFTGLATNLETGERYARGDCVEKLATLSRGVDYDDYLSNPDFWKSLAHARGEPYDWEVRKFHIFQLQVLLRLLATAGQMDILAEFLDRARPAYTYCHLVGLHRVVDELEISDAVEITTHHFLSDNPGWGLEAAFAFSSLNGRGDLIFHHDHPPLSLRLSHHGKDLEITGPSAVTTQVDLSYTRSGDHLIILGGPKTGRYGIATVGSDMLALEQLTEPWPETCPNPAEWLADPPALHFFTIQRPLRNPISFGANVEAGVETETPDGLIGTEMRFGDSRFFSDGCYPGDWLILQNDLGNTVGAYKVYAQDIDGDKIYVVGAVGAGVYPVWKIFREVFLEDYQVEIWAAIGGTVVFVAGTDLVENLVRRNETLEILDADGLVVSSHKIIQVTNPEEMFVVPTPGAIGANYSGRVKRGYPALSYDMLMKEQPAEEVAVVRVPDTDKVAPQAGAPGSFQSVGQDFAALNVLPGDEIEITTPGLNEGVHPIYAVLAGPNSEVFVTTAVEAEDTLAYRLIRRVR